MITGIASGISGTVGVKSHRRKRHSAIDDCLIEDLLRASTHPHKPQDIKQIASRLHVPYSTLTAAIRRMTAEGPIVTTHLVNPYQTRFCHEFVLSIALNSAAFKHEEPSRHKRRDTLNGNSAPGETGPLERFIDRLLSELDAAEEYRSHLIVTDAALLHGSPDRDVELSIVTDDGSYSIGRWVRNELIGNPCIRQMHTIIVGYRLSRNGYSGQHANRVSGHTEKTAEA